MATAVNNRELLGAYLCGDITPDERAAVERLLAVDGAARAEARELKALLGVLAHSERAVRPALASALRLRVEKACAGQTYEPEADQQELRSCPPAFAQFLRHGERPVSDELASRLAERVRAVLPSAGIVRVAAAQQQSRRETVQTVRVYTVQRSVWRGRLAWAGLAAAALFALAVGLARLLDHGPSAPLAPAHDVQIAANPSVETPRPPEAPLSPGELARTPKPHPEENEIAKAPRPDVPEPKQNVPPKADVRALAANAAQTPQKVDQVAGSQPPQVGQPVPRVEQSVTPAPPQLAENKAPKKVAKEGVPAQQPDQAITQPQRPPRPAGGGASLSGSVIASNGQAPSQTTGTTQGTAAGTPDSANMAVVFVTRDGHVQAQTPDGKTLALAPNQQVPSGSEIVTDQGRVGLKLPGGALFWVNGGSSLTLSFRGQDAQVTLSRGEIAYRGGGLAVVAANVEVKEAKAVDMKIEDNAAKVSVLDKQAAVGTKGRPSVRVNSGTKVTVPLTGAGQIARETFTVPPDFWTYDLQPVVPTSDPNAQRGRGRGYRQGRQP